MGKLYPNHFLSRIVAAAWVCLLMAACGKPADGLEDGRIAFRAGWETIGHQTETKTSDPVTAITSLDQFYVTASIGVDMKEQQVFGNEPFKWNEERGYYVSSRYWPKADAGYHFYASNVPIHFAFKGDYFLDTGSDSGVDVVSAYIPFGEWMQVNHLTFNHLLSRVGDVTVKPQQVGHGNTDYYTITNVVINLLPETHGHYILGDNLWEKTSTDGVLRNMATSVAALPEAPPYFVQQNDIWTLPGKFKAFLNYRAEYEEWFKDYTDIPVKVTLIQGCINDITFELGGDPVDVVFTVTVRDWNDVERNIDFMDP